MTLHRKSRHLIDVRSWRPSRYRAAGRLAWSVKELRRVPQIASGGAGQVAGADDARLLEVFDVLGRRWALRVVWELRSGGLNYRELAARIPDMSTSVLTQRLRDLRAARLVEHERGAGYQLTPQGRDLLALLGDLRDWAERVGFATDPPSG
jgi:DNA-binding HxlR family transcriptional regulator